MHVDTAKWWDLQDFLWKDLPKGCYDKNIRILFFQDFHCLRLADALWLVDRNIMFHCPGLDCRKLHLLASDYDVFPDSNRTQPFGSGATCFYNYMDLMVRNDTPDTWRLVLQVTDTHLEGEWRADGPQTCRYEVYEKEHEIRGEYWGGFTRHNTLFRRVLGMDGAELGEEFITENHAIMMYNPMLEETAP